MLVIGPMSVSLLMAKGPCCLVSAREWIEHGRGSSGERAVAEAFHGFDECTVRLAEGAGDQCQRQCDQVKVRRPLRLPFRPSAAPLSNR